MRCKYPGPAAGSVPGTQTRSIKQGAVAGVGHGKVHPHAGRTGERRRVSLVLDPGLPLSDAEVRFLLLWMGDRLGDADRSNQLDTDDEKMPDHRFPSDETPSLPKAVAYLHVSTGRQAEQGMSLDEQQRQVVACAEHHGQYRVSESVTLCVFPNQREADST